MTSNATYWICRCGKAHAFAERTCVNCGKRRPLSKGPIVGGAIAILAIAATFLGERPSKPLDYPTTQKALLTTVKGYEERWRTAPNAANRKEVLVERDRALASNRAVTEWAGVVLGVSPMADGVGIAIDIGGPRLLAGTYVTRFIDTTIARGKGEIGATVDRLKPGKRVTFSGQFEVDAGALVEISYTDEGSATTPQYLFRFTAITPNEQ